MRDRTKQEELEAHKENTSKDSGSKEKDEEREREKERRRERVNEPKLNLPRLDLFSFQIDQKV